MAKDNANKQSNPDRTRTLKFAKNFAKSTKNLGFDIARALVPDLMSSVDNTKEFTKENYDKFTSTIKKAKIKDGELRKGSATIVKNMLSDLKSGNFYNTERMSDLGDSDSDIFGDFEESGDFEAPSSDNADELFGGESSDNSDTISETKNTSINISTSDSNRQVQGISIIGKHIIESTTAGFESVNSSLERISEFNTEVTTKFYEDTTSKLADIGNTLLEMDKVLKGSFQIQNQSFQLSATTDIESIFSGALDPKSLLKVFKSKSFISGMSGIFGMMAKDLISDLKNNPIGTIGKTAVTTFMPQKYQDKFNGVNDIAKMLPFVMNEAFKKTKGKDGILGKIAESFYVDNKVKKTSLEKENKAVPFDSQAKDAITKVIPEYLRNIVDLLGGDSRIYNYKKGQFYSKKDTNKMAIDKENEDINNMISDSELYKLLAKSAGKDTDKAFEGYKKFISSGKSASSLGDRHSLSEEFGDDLATKIASAFNVQSSALKNKMMMDLERSKMDVNKYNKERADDIDYNIYRTHSGKTAKYKDVSSKYITDDMEFARDDEYSNVLAGGNDKVSKWFNKIMNEGLTTPEALSKLTEDTKSKFDESKFSEKVKNNKNYKEKMKKVETETRLKNREMDIEEEESYVKSYSKQDLSFDNKDAPTSVLMSTTRILNLLKSKFGGETSDNNISAITREAQNKDIAERQQLREIAQNKAKEAEERFKEDYKLDDDAKISEVVNTIKDNGIAGGAKALAVSGVTNKLTSLATPALKEAGSKVLGKLGGGNGKIASVAKGLKAVGDVTGDGGITNGIPSGVTPVWIVGMGTSGAMIDGKSQKKMELEEATFRAKERVKTALNNKKIRLQQLWDQKKEGLLQSLHNKLERGKEKIINMARNVTKTVGTGFEAAGDAASALPPITSKAVKIALGAAGAAAVSALIVKAVKSANSDKPKKISGDTSKIKGTASKAEKKAKKDEKKKEKLEKLKERLEKNNERKEKIKSLAKKVFSTTPLGSILMKKKDKNEEGSSAEDAKALSGGSMGFKMLMTMNPLLGIMAKSGGIFSKFLKSPLGTKLDKDPEGFSKTLFALSPVGSIFEGVKGKNGSFISNLVKLGSSVFSGLFGKLFDTATGDPDKPDPGGDGNGGNYTSGYTAASKLSGQTISGDDKAKQFASSSITDASTITDKLSQITGGLKSTLITDPYGVNRGDHTHGGIDIGGGEFPLGSPINVTAIADGVVTDTVNREKDGYGTHVEIQHGDGYLSLYAHLKYNSICVAIGDFVFKGQTIGIMGNTGDVVGDRHLHFEIRKDGTKIDPTPFLEGKKTVPGYTSTIITKLVTDATTDSRRNNVNKATSVNTAESIANRTFQGCVAAKFESNYDPSAVGIESDGQHAYGAVQFQQDGSAVDFSKWVANKYSWAKGLSGLTPGTSAFDTKWKEIAKSKPNEFLSAQFEFAKDSYYNPIAKHFKETYGIDPATRSKALSEMLFARAIHFGQSGLETVLKESNIDPSSDTDAQIIDKVYKRTADENPGRYGNRMTEEPKLLKTFLNTPGYKQGTSWVPDTQVALLHKGEMVIPRDKNPLNPDNYNNPNKLKSMLSENTVSTAYTTNQNDIIDKLSQLKTIVDEFKKLNSISEKSLAVLNNIYNAVASSNKDRVMRTNTSYELESSQLTSIFKGF